MATVVVWFRRDLRVHDHPALAEAAASGDRIAPLFVVDDRLVGGRWPAPNRLWFMAGSVDALGRDLARLGAPLALVRGDPREAVPAFAASVGATRVVVSRETTPYGRARDVRVAASLSSIGIEWLERPGVLVHEPEEVQRRDGGHFVLFGPFGRAWRDVPLRTIVPEPDRIRAARIPDGTTRSSREAPLRFDPTADRRLLPEPGEPAARVRLERWAASNALHEYDRGRDRLDHDGTSRLSQDLHFGLVSATEVVTRCDGDGAGPRRYVAELAWRDFYAHLLAHEPRVRHASFRPAVDAMWSAPPDGRLGEAWRSGTTGFPVVDAAMRQLLAAGWMPNRARMIVASFLTRDLGVDWRFGERHFMEHLVDGDVASNNGGWQWAASTGTDPQPTFRVFNPVEQGRRHDPTGEYVRRWVPELRDEPAATIHEPGARGDYPGPIVDHAEARARWLATYHAAVRSRSER